MNTLFKRTTLSLRLRVIVSIIMLLVVIGGIFSFLTIRSIHTLIEDVMWENYSSYARSFAAFSAKSFAEGDVTELQRHLDIAFAQEDMIFVVAKDLRGKIIARTNDNAPYHPPEIHKDIFEDAFVHVQEIGIEPGGLFHSSGHTFLIKTAVVYNGEKIGLVELAVNTASANQRLETISLWGFRMALTGVIIGTFILTFVDKRLKKNITRLIQITRSMAKGDLSQRVEIKTGDEIEYLGESFNLMAEAIKKHEERLEHLVELRTKELENEKNKLELILDNVPSAFLMLDNNLQVESVSSQFESVLNKKRDQVIGKKCTLSEFLYQSNARCPCHQALESGKVQSREAHIIRAGGEDRFLEHTAIPIRRNGKTERILEVVTDITSRKRFEEQLIRTEKLSATGEMAAIIAHEMRNSLSSVNLILQYMTDTGDRDEDEKKSLEVAIASVNRMESIVRQLLEFASPGEIEFQPANMNVLIEQSLGFCKYQVEKKQIKLLRKLDDQLPNLQIDIEIMREVLINLILNATQAVEMNGTIILESGMLILEKTQKGTYENASVTLRKGQQVVQVRIIDDGVGIPAENIAHIFDPFYSSKTQGTGLGLAMAKRAVWQHGGILFAESVVSKGSTFSILLPVAPKTV